MDQLTTYISAVPALILIGESVRPSVLAHVDGQNELPFLC